MTSYLPHLAGLVTATLIAIIWCVARAPAGYQDATGFHLGKERASDRKADWPRREVESVRVHEEVGAR